MKINLVEVQLDDPQLILQIHWNIKSNTKFSTGFGFKTYKYNSQQFMQKQMTNNQFHKETQVGNSKKK